MSKAQWTPGACNETAGFLFSHECGEGSVFKCDRCTKPICHAHAHQSTAGTVCTSCARNEIAQSQPGAANANQPPMAGPPGAPPVRPQPGMAGGAAPLSPLRTHASYSYYNPYFYSGYYYPGYGYYGPGYWGHSYYHDVYHHHHYGSPHYNDPNDFTSGDASGLGQEGDGDFERDYGES